MTDESTLQDDLGISVSEGEVYIHTPDRLCIQFNAVAFSVDQGIVYAWVTGKGKVSLETLLKRKTSDGTNVVSFT